MKIRIITNQVASGWKATDLNTFLGGSEECVVLLAEALVRYGFSVVVYHSMPEGQDNSYDCNGVKYEDLKKGTTGKGEVLITFKNVLPWLAGESDPEVKIHWSSDVERPWNCSALDYFVNLTEYHQLQNMFVSTEMSVVIPHGIDMKSFKFKNPPRISNHILYCSSPDRGLVTLLDNWKEINSYGEEGNKYHLNVAYGFKNIRSMHPSAVALENHIKHLCETLEDISFLGQLTRQQINEEYYRNQYWCLPLNNPMSELFCLNAVKASYCGCIPIVNRIGALSETVSDHIPYNKFVQGSAEIEFRKNVVPVYSWDLVVSKFWVPMFEKKLNKI